MFVSTKKHNEVLGQLDNIKRDNNRLAEENSSLSERNIELNHEVQRLAALISASNKECSVGPWCKDCDHIRSDKSITRGLETEFAPGKYYYTNPIVEGEVMYCSKHLHELCPEHSKNSQEE